MRKLIFVLFLFGCKQTASITSEDGCEYYVFKTDGIVTAITHKGNCSNPIHQYIDTSDLVEQSPNFKVYVRRSNKNPRVGVPNMESAPISVRGTK